MISKLILLRKNDDRRHQFRYGKCTHVAQLGDRVVNGLLDHDQVIRHCPGISRCKYTGRASVGVTAMHGARRILEHHQLCISMHLGNSQCLHRVGRTG
ncbi:hypothetical protein D3C85_1050770 [compost metagenome]